MLNQQNKLIQSKNFYQKINQQQYCLQNQTEQNKFQYNHIDGNFHLSNKKALFYNIKQYCDSIDIDPFQFIPVTFHFQEGFNQTLNEFTDKDYKNFQKFYFERQKYIKNWNAGQKKNNQDNEQKNIYIIKPGEETNRGQGIQVETDFQKIQNILSQNLYHKNGQLQTYLIQIYIDKPLLYNKRKFDIRCYMLVTSVNGILKAYWYQEGYIRTSSCYFNCNNLQNKMIHLTNDAIQKQSENYGKFELANKVSYQDFHKYLQLNYEKDLYTDFLPQMKEIAKISIKSVYGKMNQNKKQFSFEIFGLDYMIDSIFKVYLIEINTNPCFELCCGLLRKIIPNMIENAIRIAVDPIFPPPEYSKWKPQKNNNIPEKCLETNRFELIFDELQDGYEIKNNKNQTLQQIQIIEEENQSIYSDDPDDDQFD